MPLQLDVERHHPEFKINVTFYRVVDFLGRNIASWSITSYSSKEPRFILQLAFIFGGYYPWVTPLLSRTGAAVICEP